MAAVESTRSKQLRKLADSLPGANQEVQQGLEAARQINLQQTIKQAKPGAGPTAAQALGAQQAAQSGANQLQAAEQTQKDIQQVGQLASQQQGLESQQRIGTRQRENSAKQREFAARLQQLDQDSKAELLDRQLEFAKDERGRTFMNERQLADWAAANARSEQEFAAWQQNAMQMSERKIQTLKTAYDKLSQALKQGYVIEGQRLDNKQKRDLIQQQRTLEAKLREEAAKREEKNAMWKAGGTIIGAVVGGIYGGQGGAAAGGQAGGGAGEGAGSAFG